MASTWIVTFSLGWDPLTHQERRELEHHFSTVPAASASSGECWEVRVRSDTATTAVHEVSLMLGPDRQRRLVHISAAQDLAERVRAATPWRT
jgi:hypothetical protein